MPGRIYGRCWRCQEAECEIHPHVWTSLKNLLCKSVSGGGDLRRLFLFFMFLILISAKNMHMSKKS